MKTHAVMLKQVARYNWILLLYCLFRNVALTISKVVCCENCAWENKSMGSAGEDPAAVRFLQLLWKNSILTVFG